MMHNFEANIDEIVGSDISEPSILKAGILKAGIAAHPKSDQQKSLDFSAGAGLFIVIAVFFMFFMVPMAVLVSIGFEINLLPIAIAIVVSTMIAASFFLLLRFIDTSFK